MRFLHHCLGLGIQHAPVRSTAPMGRAGRASKGGTESPLREGRAGTGLTGEGVRERRELNWPWRGRRDVDRQRGRGQVLPPRATKRGGPRRRNKMRLRGQLANTSAQKRRSAKKLGKGMDG